MTLRSVAWGALASFFAVSIALADGVPEAAPPDLSGEWELTTLVFGNPLNERLTLKVDRGKVTGTNSGRTVSGKVDLDRVRFEYKDRDGTNNLYEGRLQDGKLSGTVRVSNEPWGQ